MASSGMMDEAPPSIPTFRQVLPHETDQMDSAGFPPSDNIYGGAGPAEKMMMTAASTTLDLHASAI